MKKFVLLVLAAMVWTATTAVAQPAPQPSKDPLIGIVLHQKLSYAYDSAKNAAQLVGLGPAQLESGPVTGDVKITLNFSFPENEIVRYCMDDLKQDMTPQSQYNIWGYGHSMINGEGVTVTLSRLIHCENVAYLTDRPIMGPMFQDGTPSTHNPYAPPPDYAPLAPDAASEDAPPPPVPAEKHDDAPAQYPGCKPGEGDADHPYCFH